MAVWRGASRYGAHVFAIVVSCFGGTFLANYIVAGRIFTNFFFTNITGAGHPATGFAQQAELEQHGDR